LQRHAFGRALKVDGMLDTTAIQAALEENRLNGTVNSNE
jgi:hypothetical protein